MPSPYDNFDEKRLEDLARVYQRYPNIFSQAEKDELNKIFVSQGTTLEQATEESRLVDKANQFASGIVEGFTTIGWADKPQTSGEGIAHSIGHLIGFAPGILALPAVGLSKLLARTGLQKAAQAGSTFAKVSQSTQKWSVPMMAGDKAVEVIGKVAKDNAAVQGLKFLQEGTFGREAIRSAIHLGTASAVSSWKEGIDGSFKALLHGGLAGATFQGIGQFVNLRKMINSKNPIMVNRANKIARGLAGSLFTGLPTTWQGATSADQVYQYLLGAYFGATTVPSFMRKAREHAQGLDNQGLRNPEKSKGFDKLTEDAKIEVIRIANEMIPANNEINSIVNKAISDSIEQRKTAREVVRDREKVYEEIPEKLQVLNEVEKKQQEIDRLPEETSIKQRTPDQENQQKILDYLVNGEASLGDILSGTNLKVGQLNRGLRLLLSNNKIEISKSETFKGQVLNTYKITEKGNIPSISKTRGVNVMRGSKWGNPFVVPQEYDKRPNYYKQKGFIRADSRKDAIQSYEDWIRGTAHQNFLPERRKAILDGLKSGELAGETLKYFRPEAEDSHAVRLSKLVAESAGQTKKIKPKKEIKPKKDEVQEKYDEHLRKLDNAQKEGTEVKAHGVNSKEEARVKLKEFKNDPVSSLKEEIRLLEEGLEFNLSKAREESGATYEFRQGLINYQKKELAWRKEMVKRLEKPTYEVSTKANSKNVIGDSRFSALNARLSDGRTIEEHYQIDVKGYDSVRQGKNKPPKDTSIDTYAEYKKLWDRWADENPKLIEELREASKGKILTDAYAKTEVSQARALTEILKERSSQIPPEMGGELQSLEIPLVEKNTPTQEVDKNLKTEISKENIVIENTNKRKIEDGEAFHDQVTTFNKKIIKDIADQIPGGYKKNRKFVQDLFDKHIAIGGGAEFIKLINTLNKKKQITPKEASELRKHWNSAEAKTVKDHTWDIDSKKIIEKGDVKIDGTYNQNTEHLSFLRQIVEKTSGRSQRIIKDAQQGNQEIDLFSHKQFEQIVENINKEMAKEGYYYYGGRKDSEKLIYHPFLFDKKSAKEYLSQKLKSLPSEANKHYLKLKARNKANPNYEREIASNIRYLEELNGGMSLERMIQLNKEGKGDFILDPLKFNKRMQILTTTNDKELDPYMINRDELNTVIVNAVQKKIPEQHARRLFNSKEASDVELDGVMIVTQKEFDRMILDRGGEKGEGVAKGILRSANKEEGLIMGKYAYFRADKAENVEMVKNNIQMKIYDTSAKQRGNRTDHDWKMIGKGDKVSMNYYINGKKSEPTIYKIPTKDFTINMSTSENNSKNISDQILSRQFVWNPNDGQYGKKGMDGVKEFYQEIVGKSVNGDVRQNKNLVDYYNNPTDKNLNRIDFSKVNLNEIIDIAIGKKQTNNKLFEKVWREIRRDYEDFKLFKNKDELEAYFSNGDVNQILIDIMGYKPHSILNKLNVRVNIDQLKNYLMKRIIRPKVPYSGKAIGAPITPYMRQQNVDVKAGEFMLGQGAKKKVIFTENYGEMTLEKAFNKLKQLEKSKDKTEFNQLMEDLSFAIIRVPSDSVSGTRLLRFKGFNSQPGTQIVLNGQDMTYLGGMDLDIDSVFYYQKLPKAFKQAIKKNMNEWENKKGDYLDAKSEKMVNQVVQEYTSTEKSIWGMLDPSTRLKASQGAVSSNSKLGFINNTKYVMNTLYDSAVKGNNEFNIFNKNGTNIGKVKFIPKKDASGMRSLIRTLSNLSADAGDYGPWKWSNTEIQRKIYKAGFKEIIVNYNSKKKPINALNDQKVFVNAVIKNEALDANLHRKSLELYNGRMNGKKQSIFKIAEEAYVAMNSFKYPLDTPQIDVLKKLSSLNFNFRKRQFLNPKEYRKAFESVDKDLALMSKSSNPEIVQHYKQIRERIKFLSGGTGKSIVESLKLSNTYENYRKANDMLMNDVHLLVNTADIAKYAMRLHKKGVEFSEILDVTTQSTKHLQEISKQIIEGTKQSIKHRDFQKRYEMVDSILNKMMGYKKSLSKELELLYEKQLLNSLFVDPATAKYGFSAKPRALKLNSYLLKRNDLISPNALTQYGRALNSLMNQGDTPTPKLKPMDGTKVELQDVTGKSKIENNNPLLSENQSNKDVSKGIKTLSEAAAVTEEIGSQPTKRKTEAKAIVDNISKKTKDIKLTGRGKEYAQRLADLFNWQPTIAKNFASVFEGITSGVVQGIPKAGVDLKMATFRDLDLVIGTLESMRKSGDIFAPRKRNFYQFPETVAEKLKQMDVQLFEKEGVNILTKDGVVEKTVKVPMSHFGRLQETASLFIDKVFNNASNEFQREISEKWFKDVLSRENGQELLEIAVARFEYSNMFNPKTGVEKKGSRWKLYQENLDKAEKLFEEKYKGTKIEKNIGGKKEYVDADVYIKELQNNTKKFFDSFYDRNIGAIPKKDKDGNYVYSPETESFKKYRFKSGALKGLLDINKVMNDLPKRFAAQKPENIRLQELYDFARELSIGMQNVVYRGQRMQLRDLIKKDPVFYANRMKKEKTRLRQKLIRRYLREDKDPVLVYRGEERVPLSEIAGYTEFYFPHTGHPKKIVEAFKDARERAMRKDGASQADIALMRAEMDIRASMNELEDGGLASFEAPINVPDLIMYSNKGLNKKKYQELATGSRTGSTLNRSGEGPMPKWEVSVDAISRYVDQVLKSQANILFSLSAVQNIKNFSNKNPAGKYTKDWAMFMQLYSRGVIGYPSIIPKEMLNRASFPVENTAFYWLSDQAFTKKMNQISKKYMNGKKLWKTDDEAYQKLATFSNLEAKFNLMSLLAHTKSGVANLYGGSMNTIVNAGLEPFLKAQNFKWIQDNIPPDKLGKIFKSKADLEAWAETHGATESFMTELARKNPVLRTKKFNAFFKEAMARIKKEPEMSDLTLMEIARRHGISKAIIDTAAAPMRLAERKLRRDAFVAHYIQAMRVLDANKISFERDNPWLIDMAMKGVKATQFLYSNANRPLFASTSLGRVYSRFQLFAWNSVRFRKNLIQMAKAVDWEPNTTEMKRLNRLVVADMLAFGLANAFAMSMFDASMPPPYNWIQDSATLLFGDEKSRDRAFFGTLPGPLAPLQAVSPPSARFLMQPLGNLMKNDWSDFASYQIWTWFPFGRISRDVIKLMDNPVMAAERLTGFPLHGIQRYRNED